MSIGSFECCTLVENVGKVGANEMPVRKRARFYAANAIIVRETELIQERKTNSFSLQPRFTIGGGQSSVNEWCVEQGFGSCLLQALESMSFVDGEAKDVSVDGVLVVAFDVVPHIFFHPKGARCSGSSYKVSLSSKDRCDRWEEGGDGDDGYSQPTFDISGKSVIIRVFVWHPDAVDGDGWELTKG